MTVYHRRGEPIHWDTVYYRRGGPVSVEEALTVRCPTCSQVAGEGCVYIWPKGVNPDPDPFWPRSRAQRDRIARVGELTAQPHNGRRALYSLLRQHATRQDDLARLRAWLDAFGDMFEEGKRSDA